MGSLVAPSHTQPHLIMNMQKAESFVTELNALIEQHTRITQQVAQAKAALGLSEKMNDQKKAGEISGAVVGLMQARDKAAELVVEKASRTDVQAARELMEEVTVKIEAAERFRNQTLRLKTQHELRATLDGGFETPEDRAASEQGLTEAVKQTETAMTLASAMVPTGPAITIAQTLPDAAPAGLQIVR